MTTDLYYFKIMLHNVKYDTIMFNYHLKKKKNLIKIKNCCFSNILTIDRIPEGLKAEMWSSYSYIWRTYYMNYSEKKVNYSVQSCL